MRKFSYCIILLSLFCSACLDKREFSDEELQKLVNTSLEEKLTYYRATKIERCREQLLQEASLKVDSIIFAEAKGENPPILIPKPQKPEIRAVPDTRPIIPLFDSISTKPAKKDTL